MTCNCIGHLVIVHFLRQVQGKAWVVWHRFITECYLDLIEKVPKRVKLKKNLQLFTSRYLKKKKNFNFGLKTF